MAKNIAKEVIKPSVPKMMRTVFLYTGQGDSTIVAVPTGENVNDYKYVLIDSDLDKEDNEVNLFCLFKDLLDGKKLPVFINTHPHKDHTGGIKEIYDEIGVEEVWHSNHSSTGNDKESYDELKYVLDKVGADNEFHLKGTNDLNKLRTSGDDEIIKKIGLIDYQVFAPAEYVCDDIDDENDRTGRDRIHEQCAVFKFTYSGKSILFTGDANKQAFENHITEYHNESLKANVSTASHHGSRTAFKNGKDDENPYKKHLKYIDAEYLIVSAPKQKNSPHGHPHDEAMEIYKEFFEDSKIYHLGEKPYCIIVDITSDGEIKVSENTSLIDAYSKKNCDDKKNKEINEANNRAAILKSYATQAKPYQR